jgi:hypothetical protein
VAVISGRRMRLGEGGGPAMDSGETTGAEEGRLLEVEGEVVSE